MFSLMQRLRQWQVRRSAINELRYLPDEILWDLGISRDQIEDYADGLVRAPETRWRRTAAVLPFPQGETAGPECCAA